MGKDNPLAEYLALAEKKTGLSRNKLLAIGGTAGDSITITITITITWSITIIITNILIIIIISRCCSGGWICSSASLRSHRLSLPSILFCQVDILYCCKNRFYHSFLITISSISIMITTLHLIQGPGEQTERRGAQVFNKNLLNLFRGTMHKLLFNLVILLNSIILGIRLYWLTWNYDWPPSNTFPEYMPPFVIHRANKLHEMIFALQDWLSYIQEPPLTSGGSPTGWSSASSMSLSSSQITWSLCITIIFIINKLIQIIMLFDH